MAGTAYELGLACALGRPVVIVTREGDSLPLEKRLAPRGAGSDVTR